MEPYSSKTPIRNILLLWIWNKIAEQNFLTWFTVVSAKTPRFSWKSSPCQGERLCHVATNMFALHFFTFSYANQKPPVH